MAIRAMVNMTKVAKYTNAKILLPTGEDFVQPFEGTKDPAFIFVEPPDLEVKKERKNFKDIRSQKHINLKLAKMLVDSYPSPKVLLST